MMTLAKQTKRNICIALYNKMLNDNNVCPANHEVEYGRGWFYFDGKPRHKPELTKKANEILETGSHKVYYLPLYNSYVLRDE